MLAGTILDGGIWHFRSTCDIWVKVPLEGCGPIEWTNDSWNVAARGIIAKLLSGLRLIVRLERSIATIGSPFA